MTTLHFYRTGDAYGEFSNFAAFPIELDGQIWPTTEHYFQAQKFMDLSVAEAIRAEPNPMKAAQMGRARHPSYKRNWDELKDEVMLKALRAKFAQHHSLRELWMITGDAQLIEHTANDSYWADGGDGTGLNMLGVLLMKIRQEL